MGAEQQKNPQPIQVLDKNAALGQPPNPGPPKRRFTFSKNMSPTVPVSLPNGKQIQFHVARNRNNGVADSHGTFTTTDPDEAEALRTVMKDPRHYITELTS